MDLNNEIRDTYNVAAKAFVVKEDRILLCKDVACKWDLPGGSVSPDEFFTPFEKILARELKEELGANVKYRNNGIVCIFRHRRPEVTEKGKPEKRILMLGFEIEYTGGNIVLSDEHTEHRWVNFNEALNLLNDGQLDGFKKYLEFLKSERKRIMY